MATKGSSLTERGALLDKRRSGDRRSSLRAGQAGPPGRRSTDVVDSQPGSTRESSPGHARKRRATRDGREPLVIYLRPEAIKALKITALERDTTASAIMTEALELWSRAHGRPLRRQDR